MGIRNKARARALTVCVALALTVPWGVGNAAADDATSAGCLTVKQGSDYASYCYDTGWFEVCDMEADSHGVYMGFGNSYGDIETAEYEDQNGAGGGCGNGYQYKRYKYMLVCERVPLRPDPCVSGNLYL
ncbi:hypothetical protein AB0I94_28280 [Streptomyces sp. NPDC050147]|uniref:hypothetical protein n=1 Tax=Streptomyces sp. NPDC050147 TaxID=3155513 RepID=UPI003415CE61